MVTVQRGRHQVTVYNDPERNEVSTNDVDQVTSPVAARYIVTTHSDPETATAVLQTERTTGYMV